MVELSQAKEVTVKGNFLATVFSQRIFVLCNTRAEFEEAASQIHQKLSVDKRNIVLLYKPEQIQDWLVPPTIFCWGEYWENDLIQSPVMRKALNGWL
jgi:hypothetical protein